MLFKWMELLDKANSSVVIFRIFWNCGSFKWLFLAYMEILNFAIRIWKCLAIKFNGRRLTKYVPLLWKLRSEILYLICIRKIAVVLENTAKIGKQIYAPLFMFHYRTFELNWKIDVETERKNARSSKKSKTNSSD